MAMSFKSALTKGMKSYYTDVLEVQFTSIEINVEKGEISLYGEYKQSPINAMMSIKEFVKKGSCLENGERLEFGSIQLPIVDQLVTLKAWMDYSQVKAGLEILAS
jgi:hypothetical protein